MNSAILYLRPHCSPIVNLILFFLFRWSPLSFLLIISFSFLFLPSLILAPISLFSLSLCSTSLPPSPTKPRPEHQVKLISIAMGFFFFLVCDLMLNSAVVVWVMDLAFWVVVWCASTILWIWVHGFGFAGLCSWIIDVIGVDRRLDRSHRRGSLRGRERERRRKK